MISYAVTVYADYALHVSTGMVQLAKTSIQIHAKSTVRKILQLPKYSKIVAT